MTRTLGAAAAVAAALALAGAAAADPTPVGPLPPGPVTTVATPRGSYVAVSVARPSARTGLVWRVARRVDERVLRQVSERDVGPAVVLVFRAVGRGSATVRLAATRGEASGRAVRAATWRVTVE